MAENGKNKTVGPYKSLMTSGPTLHYSHENVHRCWGLSVAVYLAACFFWTRLVSGQALIVHLADIFDPALWSLGKIVDSPLSIYEYPWHILVLGSLLGILTVIPLLTSQLLSFRYSIPMILGVIFIARLPLFGLVLLVSCIAIAARPLRFRSRIISLALCLAPSMIYWAVYGGNHSADPIRWGFSYAPWIYAWVVSVFTAGLVLGIGHFTRYKPGLVWTICLLLLASTFLLFERTIGFAELDYRLYIAGNNPEEQIEFHDHSLSRYIDQVLNDENLKSFWAGVFYPTEPILLREKLKGEIENLLLYDRWPQWFLKIVPDDLKYQSRKLELLAQYELFIRNQPNSARMPIALYYKALLLEFHPDVRYFSETETLRFYNDFSNYENLMVWQELLLRFPQSPEAMEARWRAAVQEAGQGNFDKAAQLCNTLLSLVDEALIKTEQSPAGSAGLLAAFRKPAATAMTSYKLQDLEMRTRKLLGLIDTENRGSDAKQNKQLCKLVMLNRYIPGYARELEELLAQTDKSHPLRDNILLAQALLMPDAQLRSKKLEEICKDFSGRDGGIQAMYELGRSKVQQWKKMEQDGQIRKEYLIDARSILTKFVEAYPQNTFAEAAVRLLDTLPSPE